MMKTMLGFFSCATALAVEKAATHAMATAKVTRKVFVIVLICKSGSRPLVAPCQRHLEECC